MTEKTWREEDLALAAAELVYEADDDERPFPIPEGPQYGALRDAGYRVEEVFSDPETGFKAVKLVSSAGGPPVYATAGLEFSRMTGLEIEAVLNDAEAALGTGRKQFESDRAKAMRADIGNIAQNSKVIVAGQSLGGRHTQALAYEHAAGLAEGDPNLLSAYAFNSIGGEPLVEAVRKEPVDPAVAARANVRGYSILGDPFAEKHGGRHIGPVYFYADPTPFPSGMGPDGETREPVYRGNIDNHFFGALRDIPRKHGWGPEGAERVEPPYGYHRSIDGRPADWRTDDPGRLRNPDHWPAGAAGRQEGALGATDAIMPKAAADAVEIEPLPMPSGERYEPQILPAVDPDALDPDAPGSDGWQDPNLLLPDPSRDPLDLLEIPVSEWSEADARLPIDHPLYRRQKGDPWGDHIHRQVSAYYRHVWGEGTVRPRTDGTYPEPQMVNPPKERSAIAPGTDGRGGRGGAVQVDAYTREGPGGDDVRVRSHTRGWPD